MITVGSKAAEYHGILNRQPKDVDVWLSVDETLTTTSGFDIKVIPEKVLSLVESTNGYATPDSLYTIKLSHLGWGNPNWNKHKLDILHMENIGCVIIPELYKELINFWKIELGTKDFLSLDKTKDNFFTDEVTYIYDHDLLHEKASYPNKPMYTKCLMEGKQVLTDKEKFDKLTYEDQLRMFKEEISVICFERWVIPYGKSWVESYPWSVKKTITTLTKGWATDFLIKNLKEFIKPDKQVIQNLINFIKITEEGKTMSKVDLTVFDAMYEDLASDLSKEQFFYELFNGDLDEVGYESDNSLSWREISDIRDKKLEAYGFEHIATEGGGEGGGEYCYGIIKFKDKYYKAEWSYYSYNGCDYDYIVNTIKEVKPKEKTIIVYR